MKIDLIKDIASDMFSQWLTACGNWLTGWKDAFAVFTQASNYFPPFIPGGVKLPRVILAFWDALLANNNKFTNTLAGIPRNALISAFAEATPVPAELRSRVMKLDDVVRLVLDVLLRHTTEAVFFAPPWWLQRARSIKASLDTYGKWTAVLTGAFGRFVSVFGIMFKVVEKLLVLNYRIFSTLVAILVLVGFAEEVVDQEKRDKLFSKALGQRSPRHRFGLTDNGRRVGSVRRRVPGGSPP